MRAPAIPPKRINRSRRQRKPRPRAVEYEITLIAVGAGCGIMGGVFFEVTHRPSAIYMFAGGVIGMAFGGAAELGRYWWRKRRRRDDTKHNT